MSELIQKHDNRATIRWKLLTGASALALTVYVSSASMARAEDSDTPQVWITLGGELDMLQGESAPFTAPFMTAITPTPGSYKGGVFSQNQARDSLGLDGKISFQPEDSDWIFSAGIRYGRTHSNRHVHNQTKFPTFKLTASTIFGSPITYSGVPYTLRVQSKPAVARFTDVKAPSGDKHTILDFAAGKDVGLGIFGRDGTSTLSAGIRLAEFTSDTNLDIQARPIITPHFSPFFFLSEIPKFFTWDQYEMTGHAERSFKGVGPTISWEASSAIAGNPQNGEITVDWGIDIAALFGRQKARVEHATQESHYYKSHGGNAAIVHQIYHHPTSATAYRSTRSRRVTVPELSGFIGLSAKLPHSKVSIGYKGDIWFGAVDRGIDTRKTSNLTFNGPYASISVGLGD